MSQQTSGYENFDLLNLQAAIASGGQTPVREPSKFTSAINSINQFLQTATNTIVTVDGVINRRDDNSGYQPSDGQLYPGQHMAKTPQGSPLIKYMAVAGLAVGGSILAYKGLKK